MVLTVRAVFVSGQVSDASNEANQASVMAAKPQKMAKIATFALPKRRKTVVKEVVKEASNLEFNL
ncbi:MAG: hypothetical protein WCK57_06210 [Verrucomicrobiae bacterium]